VSDVDAIIVGSGPNGLAAAVLLARAGWKVCVYEQASEVGGAARSAARTRPGFVHDVGSAIHPLAAGSPFFRSLPLDDYGLRWVQPELPLAHPLGGDRCAVLHRSLADTARRLGTDRAAYRRLVGPLADRWDDLLDDILQPVLHLPESPLLLARFGLRALAPATLLARLSFQTEEARALWAGLAAHSNLPLSAPGSSAFGVVLGVLAHAIGWPFPEGGAGAITKTLARYLEELGGRIETDAPVRTVDALPRAQAVLLNLTPRQILDVAGHRFSETDTRRLSRYRYGPGAFKVDYALREPIPWRAEACRRAGTVHVGGPLPEVAASEAAVAEGSLSPQPFVLLAQHSRFDPTRAPDGQHTAWAYCHVPNGSPVDATERIERQIERFAPGFRDVILDRAVMAPADLQAGNPNLIGGDVNGGSLHLAQLIARPLLSPTPYRLPASTRTGSPLYVASASAPPGGGVHGMAGANAARAVLSDHDGTVVDR